MPVSGRLSGMQQRIEFKRILEDIMRIDIITVVPELLESPLGHSIVGRAIKKGIVDIHVLYLRIYG